jgi:hypothetical protein
MLRKAAQLGTENLERIGGHYARERSKVFGNIGRRREEPVDRHHCPERRECGEQREKSHSRREQ